MSNRGNASRSVGRMPSPMSSESKISVTITSTVPGRSAAVPAYSPPPPKALNPGFRIDRTIQGGGNCQREHERWVIQRGRELGMLCVSVRACVHAGQTTNVSSRIGLGRPQPPSKNQGGQTRICTVQRSAWAGHNPPTPETWQCRATIFPSVISERGRQVQGFLIRRGGRSGHNFSSVFTTRGRQARTFSPEEEAGQDKDFLVAGEKTRKAIQQLQNRGSRLRESSSHQ